VDTARKSSPRSKRAPAGARRERTPAAAARPRRWPPWLEPFAEPVWRWLEAHPTVGFVVVLAFLDTLVNLRFPGDEPALWYVIPSIDLVVVFAYIGWFESLRWKVHKGVRVALVVCLLLIRFLRFGDGVEQRYFAQPFHVYTDLPLVPELVRLAYSSLPGWKFVLLALVVLGGVVGLAYAAYGALLYAEYYLAKARHRYVALGIVAGCFVIVGSFSHPPRDDELYFKGGLAQSIVPRVQTEARMLSNIYGGNRNFMAVIQSVERRWHEIPTNLAKLQGKNVHLILIESYGQAVLEWPPYVAATRSVYDAFEEELSNRGFSIVTGVLDSPTYGGHSWLAHATLATGIRTSDQLEYDIVTSSKPKTIAQFFREAGYRTVLLQPGTTREWPRGEFYSFERKYYSWNFNYKGPTYAWATMPDQYVLDFARRNVLPDRARPSFVQYVLVSSHAPWSDLPELVPDWSTLGDGSLYNRLPTIHHDIVWPKFDNADGAYIESVIYDLRVIQRYVADYITDDSLIIVLGDHQPVAEVNGHTDSFGVPVHVISRDKGAIAPFADRGYTAGMRQHAPGAHPGLDTFLEALLRDFSR
jgi:hypothetical protein